VQPVAVLGEEVGVVIGSVPWRGDRDQLDAIGQRDALAVVCRSVRRGQM